MLHPKHNVDASIEEKKILGVISFKITMADRELSNAAAVFFILR